MLSLFTFLLFGLLSAQTVGFNGCLADLDVQKMSATQFSVVPGLLIITYLFAFFFFGNPAAKAHRVKGFVKLAPGFNFYTMSRNLLDKNGVARLRLARSRHRSLVNPRLAAAAVFSIALPLVLAFLLCGPAAWVAATACTMAVPVLHDILFFLRPIVNNAVKRYATPARRIADCIAKIIPFVASGLNFLGLPDWPAFLCYVMAIPALCLSVAASVLAWKFRRFFAFMRYWSAVMCATASGSSSGAPSGSTRGTSASVELPFRPGQLPLSKPAKRKGPGDDDGDEGDNPNKRGKGENAQPIKQDKLSSTKAHFDRFLQAYRGELKIALGSDAPVPSKNRVDMFKSQFCAVLVSTNEETLVSRSPGEAWKYAYNIFSQNTAIELRAGPKVPNTSFQQAGILDINSEQMEKDPARATIPSVNVVNLKSKLSEMGVPAIKTSDAELRDVLEEVKTSRGSVDCIVFKITQETCPLWIRRPLDCSSTSKLCDALQPDLPSVTYVTIVRAAVEDKKRFADEFWDYLIQRCIKDGIYWGYDLKRQCPPDEDGEVMPYPHQVIRGLQDAPHLSWNRLPDSQEWLSLPYKPFMTSPAEWEAVYTIGLLHDVDHQRTEAKAIYSFLPDAPKHEIVILADDADAKHFAFYVTAGHVPLMAAPRVPGGTKFKIRCASPNENSCELEGSSIELEGVDADVVLDVRLKEGISPWGNGFETGFFFQVKLEMELNISAAIRQLDAISAVALHGSDADKRILCSRHWENTPQAVPFNSIREASRDLDRKLYNAINDWEDNLSHNQLQSAAIQSCMQSSVSFIQGPPGTGKSVVACDAAILVASLGKNVVIASPTNAAGKSNATKLAETLSSVPEEMAKRFHVVYFPTYRESIERIYDAKGYQTRRGKLASDDKFEPFQLWQRVAAFAFNNSGTIDAASRFSTTLTDLENAGAVKTVLKKDQLDEFRQDFKQLANYYLHQHSLSFIVISTCNNSYALSQLKFECGLLLVDEAGLTTENDLAVPLQIKHEALGQVGDHLQIPPTVTSGKHNEEYDQMKVSNFERNISDPTVHRTMLRINYRFGKVIADSIGIFGGYEGLASLAGKFRSDYSNFSKRMLGNPKYVPIKHPRNSRRITEDSLKAVPKGKPFMGKESKLERSGDYHRLCLNVLNGHSSQAAVGQSSVNYASLNAILDFIGHLLLDETIKGSDIGIGTPFVSQAKLFREQINIRFPNKGIEVFTTGVSQGSQKKFFIADFTVANETEGAFLGFLRTWNRLNVMKSRGQVVLVNVINFDLMRSRLQSIYAQSRTWAYFLIDQLDSGLIFNVEGRKELPKDQKEYLGNTWSLKQLPSSVRNLPAHAEQASQVITFEPDGTYAFTKFEKKLLQELHAKRAAAKVNIDAALADEKAYQMQRKKDIAVRKRQLALMDGIIGSELTENMDVDEEMKVEESDDEL